MIHMDSDLAIPATTLQSESSIAPRQGVIKNEFPVMDDNQKANATALG